MPSGSKWLSHSFDIYQSGLPAFTKPEQKIALIQDAIHELSELEGGKDAFDQAQQEFEAEHGRKSGDVDAARRDYLERNPNMGDYANSAEFVNDRNQSDMHWLAFRMSRIITQTHNPRTPNYLDEYHAEHGAIQDAYYREHDFIQYQELLDALPEHLRDALRNMKAEMDRLTRDNEELLDENARLRDELRDR